MDVMKGWLVNFSLPRRCYGKCCGEPGNGKFRLRKVSSEDSFLQTIMSLSNTYVVWKFCDRMIMEMHFIKDKNI